MERSAVGVGFDLDHTLAIDNKLERVAFLRLLEHLLAIGGHTMGTIFEESDRIDALLAEQRSGAFSIDEAVARFAAERGVAPSPEYAERFRRMAQEMVAQFVVPLPGVAATLEALRRRGIPVAVLSNGWNPLQVLKAQRAGFDGPVVASADVGQQKPGALAFEALLRALNTRPEQTWYVGDDPRCDVIGARDAGIHAVWLDDEKREYPPELPPPPYRIGTLEELLTIV
jgi:putative hydrolase of the HAD superfamily